MYILHTFGYILLYFFTTIVISAKVKVAVYEHVVISPDYPEVNFTRQEAFMWMLKNLDVYAEQTRMAARQGAKIIVFPEYGITGFDHSRDSIMPFLENIPDVTDNWNPCSDSGRFMNTMVLQNLSCIARVNNIHLVANMGDIKTCDRTTDEACPQDGRYQFNTNVVFDDEGKLIARYHKRNMYDETPLFDPSPTVEYVFFETQFGKFGTIVCFDLMHYYPTQVLLDKYGIRNLLVTSAWNVFLPFTIPLQMYSGLAKRNNINVIASNVRNNMYSMAGSGIFGADVEISSDVNFGSPDGVFLIAELETDVPNTREASTKLTPIGEYDEIKPYQNQTHLGTYAYGMDMKFSVMEGQSGSAAICEETVCCVVEYQFKFHDEGEIFVISVADLAMEEPGIIHMQFCAVHRCASKDLDSCGDVVISAKSIFDDIKIQAFFEHGLVFPFVSTTKFGNATLEMEMDNYEFDEENAILHSNKLKYPLLAAVVFNSFYIGEHPQPTLGKSSSAEEKIAPESAIVTLLLLIHIFTTFSS